MIIKFTILRYYIFSYEKCLIHYLRRVLSDDKKVINDDYLIATFGGSSYTMLSFGLRSSFVE